MLKHNTNNKAAAAAIENWRMSKTGTASNRSGATTRTTGSSKRGAEKSTIIKGDCVLTLLRNSIMSFKIGSS